MIDVTGDLFLIVYSIDSRESFDEARRLQEQVFLAKGGQATSGGRARTPYIPLVIVGNKTDSDSERVVDASELRSLVDRYPNCCGGIETSAKRYHNVDEVRSIILMLSHYIARFLASQVTNMDNVRKFIESVIFT